MLEALNKNALSNTNDKNATKVSNQNTKTESAEKIMKTISNKIKNLVNCISEFEKENYDQNPQINTNKQTIISFNDLNENFLAQENQNLNQKIEIYENVVKQHETVQHQKTQKIWSQDHEISKLKISISKLSQENENLKNILIKENKELKFENSKLIKQNATLTKKWETLKPILVKLKNKNHDLTKKLNSKSEIITESKEVILEQKEIIEEQDLTIENFKRLQKENLEEINFLQNELESVKQHQKGTENKAKAFKYSIKKYQNKIEILDEKLNQSRRENASYESKVQILNEKFAKIENLDFENENEEEKNICAICFEQKIEVALLNCGHTLCSSCSKNVRICPFCRSHIQKILKLHLNN